MKKIVFILEDYHPNYSAVGVCIKNVVEELVRFRDYTITIITLKSDNTQRNTHLNEALIRYVNTNDNYLRNRISEKLKTARGLRKYILQTEKISVRGYGYICAFLGKSNIKKQDVRAFLRELNKIDDKIDVIIPTCLPFESVLAALEFKKKSSYEVKVIPFLFDKFSENRTLHRTENNRMKKFKMHLSLEKQMLEECDKVLFVDSWAEHLQANFFSCVDKFCQVEHPLLKRIVSTETVLYDNGRINVVYTGALYKKIRSPLHALKLFSRLIEVDKRILLHFYINGDCNSIVNSYCEKYPENIINHGSVPTSFAKAAIMNADLLLSIGNTDITQLPSKIFEYISTGKPVAHFYFNQDDQIISILSDYDNSCCIKIDESLLLQGELNLQELLRNVNKNIDFAEVQNIFYKATPRFTANKIVDLI
ncbi:hypothetical protein JT05_11130 [Desulfosporosinus sp. Tol-M]|nr:hypothetical protein JT05_11130 [Desulfosporosinus sp. Tol-M]